ncbi:MAG TPA: M1 family aminopeptidase [Dehalococcoidia bacterium]|nr:M1 family aminopeptidase [Dehalococcoidia bacterium]
MAYLEGVAGCRGHGEELLSTNGDGGFSLPGDKPHYPRDRSVDITHVRLDIALDLDAKRISGSVAHSFEALNDDLTALELDAIELEILDVRLADGPALKYAYAGGRVRIGLERPLAAGEKATVIVNFAGSPRRGLYFIGPDEGYPDKRLEAWTQGEDEDSRHWFPCYDYPNEMATSEMHVTVREPFTVIAIGALTGVEPGPQPGTRTFHWSQETPHVTYLTSVVAGEYVEIRDEWEGIPVLYYVPPGKEADGRELFKNTPAIMALFSERTGVRYPYAKYSQVVVQDFIFGGMENVSATTITDTALLDQRARLDNDVEYLVAHELAHQWFGDLLTCRDWSHGWLNEGFATFFELVWCEQSKGRDEFLLALQGEIDNYIGESARYKRPIVTNVYNEPIDLFDRHLYEKGGIVLNMLRAFLGDALYWKAIRNYVASRRGHNVVTGDLQRAIEEATGKNLDWFFDQWVFGAGHPELKGSYAWDDETKLAKLSLTQTQKGERIAEAFRLPLRLDFRLENGETSSTKVEMTEREQAFYIPMPSKPRFVSLDCEVLKTLDLDRPTEMLKAQIESDDNVLGRIEAARALGKKGDRTAIEALAKAVREDGFWGVQAEAAKALGSVRSNGALDELLASTAVKHPKARRAVYSALGEFREERAAEALEKVIDGGDESYYVEARAAAAIGKTRSPRAFAVLQRALTKDSMNDTIRSSAFAGFGELKDERGLPLAIEWSRYGKPQNVRGGAVGALAKLGEVVPEHQKEEVIDHLIDLLDDRWLRVQESATSALRELKASKALPALERTAQRALDGRVVRAARLAAKAIRSGGAQDEATKKLREEVDKLTDENKTLKDRLDKIETRLNPRTDGASDMNA